MAVAGEAFDMGARLFLRCLVKDDLDDLALRDQLGGQADNGTPEGPSYAVERTTEADVEA